MKAVAVDTSALLILFVDWQTRERRSPVAQRIDLLNKAWGGKRLPRAAFEQLWEGFVNARARHVPTHVLAEVRPKRLPLDVVPEDVIRFQSQFRLVE